MYEYNNMWDPNVVNALGLQQQQYQQQPYYQQQGNMVNTGYGYNMFNNMPYYSGNYNMNNPYLVEQQRRQQYERQQEEIKRRDNFIYKIDNIARRALGEPEYYVQTEQEQERLSPEEQMEQYQNYRMDADMAFVQSIDNEQHITVNKYALHAQSIANNLQKAKDALPENPTASDCLKKMSDDYIQAKENEMRKKAFANNYNSKGYGQLLDRDKRGGSYFNGVFGGLDNTVNFTTPDSEFLEHKKMFLELISRQL